MFVYLPHPSVDIIVVLERFHNGVACGYLQREDEQRICFWTYDLLDDHLDLDWDAEAASWTFDMEDIYVALIDALRERDTLSEPGWFLQALATSKALATAQQLA